MSKYMKQVRRLLLVEVLKKDALMIIESTLAPSTMQSVSVPTLEDTTSWKVNDGFFVEHYPERVTPGRLKRMPIEMSRLHLPMSPSNIRIGKNTSCQ